MEKFMREALIEAQKAYKKNEVPIGCVIVQNNKIIARAHNLRHTKKVATSHAEILAIEKACKKVKDWRLTNAELYVTLEPCLMCAGACYNARIKKVVFGCYDENSGAFGGSQNINLTNVPSLNHTIEIKGGILENECKEILQKFFKQKRK